MDGASYYSAVTESDFRLDWSWPAERLRRMIRVSPGQCFTGLAGRRLYCLDGEVVPGAGAVPPGTLLRLGRGAGLIRAGDGALRVHRVRLDGGETMTLAEACRERGIEAGSRCELPV
jgi:methionyl-tRNA formyltransferase